MAGRPLRDEGLWCAKGYDDLTMRRRRAVLRETLALIERDRPRLRWLAEVNHARWGDAPEREVRSGTVEVHAGDWGEVTLQLSRAVGARFAVLNMANAHVPGGGYVEGMAAQEENMFRRSDCHFSISAAELTQGGERYTAELTARLSGQGGRVYLDVERPRICVRGAEDRAAQDLGYRWLPEDEVFSFYELRAAAIDLRDGTPYDEEGMRARVAAQLDTLCAAGVRHAVLGAFGCGAFCNPADRVAALYRDAITARRGDFALIAFAIFHAGYGPDNFTPFRRALEGLGN